MKLALTLFSALGIGLGLGLGLGGTVSAQEAKNVKVRWFGHACFQIETPSGKKIVFDPHNIPAYGMVKPEADLVLMSHEHDDHTQTVGIAKFKESKPKVLRGLKPAPGIGRLDWNAIDEKWEGYRVRTFGTYHDEVDGTKRGKNSMFIVDIDGLVICHCGDLGHEFTEKQIKQIGPIDVLLVPVGGIYTINGRTAVDVADSLKPKQFVLPMHYGIPESSEIQTAEEFLDVMAENKKPVKKMQDKSELVVPIGGKPDGYSVVLLGWKKE